MRDHEYCHDLVCNGDRRYPRGARAVGCSCASRESRERHQLNELRAEIEAAWLAIEQGWDIEDRAYFEKTAPTNGFKYPLAQAVHHMWKRATLTQPPSDPAVLNPAESPRPSQRDPNSLSASEVGGLAPEDVCR